MYLLTSKMISNLRKGQIELNCERVSMVHKSVPNCHCQRHLFYGGAGVKLCQKALHYRSFRTVQIRQNQE